MTYRIVIACGLLSVAASLVAPPMANAACDRTVGQSIDSYLKRHPGIQQQLAARSAAEGGGGNALDFLNRHPDVRQHLIGLSQKCTR